MHKTIFLVSWFFWEIFSWDLLILRNFFREISSTDFIEEFLDFFFKRFLQGISRFLRFKNVFFWDSSHSWGWKKNGILIILVKSVQFCNLGTVLQKTLFSLQNAVIIICSNPHKCHEIRRTLMTSQLPRFRCLFLSCQQQKKPQKKGQLWRH